MPRRRSNKPVGTIEEYRELVALVGSLDQPEDEVTPKVVAERLGCTQAHAEDLVNLLLTTWDVNDRSLALFESAGGLQLVSGARTRGRRLRLTPDETRALLAALERVGMAQDDELREKLSTLLPDASGQVAQASTDEVQPQVGATLATCARALREGLPLSFDYLPTGDGAPTRRLARVQGTRSEGGRWYLDALDLSRQATRSFRVDRMSDVVLERDGAQPPALDDSTSGSGTATVLFRDPSLLDLFDWHGVRIISRGKAGVRVSLPYYGGDWLPAHLAACGDSVLVDNPRLRDLVREHARRQLELGEARM